MTALLRTNIDSIKDYATQVSNSLVQQAVTTDAAGQLNSFGQAM